ncbi:hypothetical protein [Sorangium sp. So ce1389]|uniref:hypothetical protein n=1 Tax=Sorangium sp. So ce1389 TaxID=3133336 RepID=UPI003F6375A7
MAAVSSSPALGPGAEIRAPTAAVLIGGLLVSAALGLVVMPAFYVFADDAKARLVRLDPPRVRRARP